MSIWVCSLNTESKNVWHNDAKSARSGAIDGSEDCDSACSDFKHHFIDRMRLLSVRMSLRWRQASSMESSCDIKEGSSA